MSADIPTASHVESDASSVEEMVIDLDTLTLALKSLEPADLFKVMKQALAEAEKRSKGTGRVATTAKKAGSMPKGVVPPQLKKPRAWVDFTLKHALQNGWESFTVYQSKKDKLTGETTEEEIEMPGSVLYEGAYVYEGSVTEKQPTGKQLIHKDAMSLSKQRWAPKDKTGTHPELYEEFEAAYAAEEADISDASSTTSSEASSAVAPKKAVIKMTAAEKMASAEAKKAEKEAEKAALKAAKEEEKAVKKAAKEAEKAAAKAAKEEEKAAAKMAKEAAKKPAVKAPIPAAAVKKVAETQSSPAVAKQAVTVKKVAAKPVTVAVEEWTCPEGEARPWTFKGKNYLRSSDNEVWLRGADGGCGEWQGVFIIAEGRIDDSVEEPTYDE